MLRGGTDCVELLESMVWDRSMGLKGMGPMIARVEGKPSAFCWCHVRWNWVDAHGDIQELVWQHMRWGEFLGCILQFWFLDFNGNYVSMAGSDRAYREVSFGVSLVGIGEISMVVFKNLCRLPRDGWNFWGACCNPYPWVWMARQ